MKIKLFIIGIAIINLFSFSGCGKNDTPEIDSTASTTEETYLESESEASTETIDSEKHFGLNKTASIGNISFAVSSEWGEGEGEDENSLYFYCYDDNGAQIGLVNVLYKVEFDVSESQKLELLDEKANSESVISEIESTGAYDVSINTTFLTNDTWAAHTLFSTDIDGVKYNVSIYDFFIGNGLYAFSFYDLDECAAVKRTCVNMFESISEL